jgi:hypothetical protein
MSDSTSTSRAGTFGRGIASTFALFLAVLCIGVGALSVWLHDQVLDTQTWTETSRQAIQQPEVQSAVATWAVDQVYELTDPADAIAQLLPDRAAILAGPLSSRLRTEAYVLAEKAMADARVEDVWVEANRRAHTRFLRVVEGTDPIILETSNGIRIDLRPLLERIAERIGVSPELVDRIPERIATVEPQRSEEVERGLKILRFLDAWGKLVTYFALPLLALGIWLAPNRRRAWMWTGAGVILVGISLEFARDALGPVIASLLTESSTWRAAILATWDVTSGTIDDAALTGVIVGTVAIIVGLCTGPSGPARSMRRVLAPLLVDRALLTVAASGVLGLVALGSLPSFTNLRPGVLVILLAGALGSGWALTRAARSDAALEVPAATVPAPIGDVDSSKDASDAAVDQEPQQ